MAGTSPAMAMLCMLGPAKIQDARPIRRDACSRKRLAPEFAGFARRRYRTMLTMLPARKHSEPIR